MSLDHAKAHAAPRRKVMMGDAARGGRIPFMDLNIHPRSYVWRRLLLNYVLPALALATIALVIFFPNPAALSDAIKQATSPFRKIALEQQAERTNALFLVEDDARDIPGLAARLEAHSDCFVGLDTAPPARLAECAPAVTEIIAQIVAHQDNPEVARAITEPSGKIMPKIVLAAAEICRTLWASGKRADAFLNDPSCRMAQVTLAPPDGLR